MIVFNNAPGEGAPGRALLRKAAIPCLFPNLLLATLDFIVAHKDKQILCMDLSRLI